MLRRHVAQQLLPPLTVQTILSRIHSNTCVEVLMLVNFPREHTFQCSLLGASESGNVYTRTAQLRVAYKQREEQKQVVVTASHVTIHLSSLCDNPAYVYGTDAVVDEIACRAHCTQNSI